MTDHTPNGDNLADLTQAANEIAGNLLRILDPSITEDALNGILDPATTEDALNGIGIAIANLLLTLPDPLKELSLFEKTLRGAVEIAVASRDA